MIILEVFPSSLSLLPLHSRIVDPENCLIEVPCHKLPRHFSTFSDHVSTVEIWSRFGRDLVEIRSRLGREMSRSGRDYVEIESRLGRDLVEIRSRSGRDLVEIRSRNVEVACVRVP